jgi:hypothetical protein
VPVPFEAPEWAPRFPAEADLLGRNHSRIDGGYWWIEVGLPHHQIHGNEEIKHEALRQLLGVWDHIKNRCEHRDKARNYGLDFVSFWPYKCEARRIVGDYILTQRDLQDPPVHADAIAFGCWYIDIHKPSGILARSRPNTRPAWENAAVIPYGIPLRSCYSRNVGNLMMAGRPISTSYVAFSSTRVLRTGVVVGQGVGVAAALCRRLNCTPKELACDHAAELRRLLERQDCYVPGYDNDDPSDLARGAEVTASSEAALAFPESGEFARLDLPAAQLFPVSSDRIEAGNCCCAYGPENVVRGTNRPDRWPNLYVSDAGRGFPAWMELRLAKPARLTSAQITFDTDMNRHSRQPLFVYPDCVKRYDVQVDSGGGWSRVAGETGNYMRRRMLTFPAVTAGRVRIEVHETHGARSARIYEVRLDS